MTRAELTTNTKDSETQRHYPRVW